MITQKVKTHPAIMFASQVAEICKPLSKVDIDFFSHVRTFEDGSISILCNRPDISIACAESQLYHNARYTKPPRFYTSGYYIWNNDNRTDKEEEHSALLRKHGISNGLTIIRREAEYCDFFHFASSPNNSHINNFYVNNLEAFGKFADFFLEKAHQLIRISERNRIKVAPEENDLEVLSKEEKANNDSGFMRVLTQNGMNSGSINLSKRQKDCLYWLLKGKTAAETANILNLSQRTVESYINHIKIKFQCSTKSELIVKALKLISKDDELLC